MIVFGFEGWDIFMVLGAALILQIVKVNSLVIWGICGVMSGFLILVKRGKPANASEHYMDWFFKDKRFTAFPQAFAMHTEKDGPIRLFTSLRESRQWTENILRETALAEAQPVPAPVVRPAMPVGQTAWTDPQRQGLLLRGNRQREVTVRSLDAA